MKFLDILKRFLPEQAPKLGPIKLNELGFDRIVFPILIIDGSDLELVYTLRDFAIDPDIFFWEYDRHIELLDSSGNIWSWKYDHTNKTNLPGDLKRTATLDEVKALINNYFQNTRVKNKVEAITEKVNSISELMVGVADKF